MRRLLTLILLLVALPAGAGLFDSRPGASLGGGLDGGDFLKVDQAFKPSVERSDAQHVLLRFVNAEGYYLYRHRFQFKVEPAQVSLGQVQLPAGKQHHDEYFGDTEVYYNIVDLEIPLNNPARQPYTLVVTYQGLRRQGPLLPRKPGASTSTAVPRRQPRTTRPARTRSNTRASAACCSSSSPA